MSFSGRAPVAAAWLPEQPRLESGIPAPIPVLAGTGITRSSGTGRGVRTCWQLLRGPDRLTGTESRSGVEGYSTDQYSQWASDYIRGAGRTATNRGSSGCVRRLSWGPRPPPRGIRAPMRTHRSNFPLTSFLRGPQKPEYLNRSHAWVKADDGWNPCRKSGEQFGDEAGRRGKSYADFVRQMNELCRALDEGIGQVLQRRLRNRVRPEKHADVFAADQGFRDGRTRIPQQAGRRTRRLTIPRSLSRCPAGFRRASSAGLP